MGPIFFLFPAELSELYAFQYSAPDIPERTCGWDQFDYQSEFLRMGAPNHNWVLSNINKEYEVRDLDFQGPDPNNELQVKLFRFWVKCAE